MTPLGHHGLYCSHPRMGKHGRGIVAMIKRGCRCYCYGNRTAAVGEGVHGSVCMLVRCIVQRSRLPAAAPESVHRWCTAGQGLGGGFSRGKRREGCDGLKGLSSYHSHPRGNLPLSNGPLYACYHTLTTNPHSP